jgi:hypothetical protein
MDSIDLNNNKEVMFEGNNSMFVTKLHSNGDVYIIIQFRCIYKMHIQIQPYTYGIHRKLFDRIIEPEEAVGLRLEYDDLYKDIKLMVSIKDYSKNGDKIVFHGNVKN